LSSRFGGYHSLSGLNLASKDDNVISGHLGFGGEGGRTQKRTEYCLNRGLWSDLEKFNCESYKNDVILGNINHE
jgi:hypothetical protein